jgi:hypothetical protein
LSKASVDRRDLRWCHFPAHEDDEDHRADDAQAPCRHRRQRRGELLRRDGREGVDVDVRLEDEALRDRDHGPLRVVERTLARGGGLHRTEGEGDEARIGGAEVHGGFSSL